jgi:hypothetical protein
MFAASPVFFAKTMPRSSRKAGSWLMAAARREIRLSRTRWMPCRSGWSSVLSRDEAHVLAPYSFGNRLGVQIVVLVRLHEGLYKLRYDQPRIMD